MKFSVVIPTYNRRDVVCASVLALERQVFSPGFEVIVVVDGSTDSTATQLRALELPFPLRVLEQGNSGAAAARNRGAQEARGEILLFLDDDMEADPQLLAEHERSHGSGCEVVIGHIPLHRDSPEGMLARGVGTWAEKRLLRLTTPGEEPALHDLLTGQLSVRKQTFDSLGGFDSAFTRDGAFGNEDIDFGHRVLEQGYSVIFNPRAVSWQRYVVTPDGHLRQWRDAGRADVLFARKYPERAGELFKANGAERWRNRLLWRPLLAVPGIASLLSSLLRRSALAMAGRESAGFLARRVFKEARFVQYWNGVREAGGIPRGVRPRVLAYHSISELPADSPLAPYAVPPAVLERQLDTLLAAGFRFVDADAVLDFLCRGTSLPPRAILLTFDDCYSDLLDSALPILQARAIPAVAFAVSGQVGGTNSWDRGIGGPELRLLDSDGLRLLSSSGVEVGAHSRTHEVLPRLPGPELAGETDGCAADIAALGLPRPRLFSFPHGESSRRAATAVRAAGFVAAFTVRPAPLRRGSNPLALPRIEILSSDVGEQFACAVAGARSPRRFLPGVRRLTAELRRAWDQTQPCSPESARGRRG